MNTTHTPTEWAERNAEMLREAWTECDRLRTINADLQSALAESERTLRWAAQESDGKVRREIVGGWIHQADKARAALARARGTA